MNKNHIEVMFHLRIWLHIEEEISQTRSTRDSFQFMEEGHHKNLMHLLLAIINRLVEELAVPFIILNLILENIDSQKLPEKQ